MTAETRPIWRDPIYHLAAFAIATVATATVLHELVLLEYVWPAVIAALRPYAVALADAPVEAAVTLSPLLPPGATSPSHLIAVVFVYANLALIVCLLLLVLCAIYTAPFWLSYAFWRYGVYEYVYKPHLDSRRGDSA